MCADKSAGVRDGTEAFALGGFTETLGGIQAAILKVKVRASAAVTDISIAELRSGSARLLGGPLLWRETAEPECRLFRRYRG